MPITPTRLFLMALIVVSAFSIGEFDKKFVKSINNWHGKKAWTAGVNINIDLEDQEALRMKCGVKASDAHKSKFFMHYPPNADANIPAGRRLQVGLPLNFDLRTQYSRCWSISYIRDQAGCGSCWAVSSGSSLSDRYCINYSNATFTAERSFSYQDIIERCPVNVCGTDTGGCNGGWLQGGYAFAMTYGVVSGENFQNTTSCKPYIIQPNTPWTGVFQNRTSCESKTYSPKFDYDKKKISSYTNFQFSDISSQVLSMMKAIYERGTIIAYMDVYMDFYSYKTGVYSVTKTPENVNIGGHAVRIIGWGSENGNNYWLCANSWGTFWGINGFFKIARGVNEANIESLSTEAIF